MNVDEFLADYTRKAAEHAAKQETCKHEWVLLMSSVRNGWKYTQLRHCMHCEKVEVRHS